MFVSFFSLVMFTSMSSEREFSPTIMPSYTSVPGSVNSTPRSWRLVIAKAVTAPARSATSEPLLRVVRVPNQLVALVDGVRDARTAGVGQELRTEADQTARRHHELHADPARAVVGHVVHPALAHAHELGDGAHVLLGTSIVMRSTGS